VGAKFFHWERRGVPVVLEPGPRDLAAGKIASHSLAKIRE
jgi:prolyl-tRNA synthetase